MSEHELQQRLLLALGRGDTRLFRNNVALAWVGQSQAIRQPVTLRLNPGDTVIRHARPLHAGLCPGSADLVGWRTITITPEMVGQQVAVFASIEVKAPRGRVSPEQVAWDATVRRAGGLSGIARSIDDARGILDLNQLPK
jgi:hypothetical protein